MVMLVKSFKQNRVLLNHFGFSIECSAAIQTCIMEWYQIHARLRFQFYYMSRIIFMWIGDSFGMTCKPFIRNPRGRHTMLVNTNRLHANLIESMCDWIENETPPPPTNVGKNPWHLTECPKCSSEQLKQRKFQSTNAINANNTQHRNSPLVRRGSRARRRKRETEREREKEKGKNMAKYKRLTIVHIWRIFDFTRNNCKRIEIKATACLSSMPFCFTSPICRFFLLRIFLLCHQPTSSAAWCWF